VAADGTELSSKRVSKLSRRYHRHKKQLRQSAMMTVVSSDAWVCPKCSYENQDYQRGMGPGCDEVRPGSIFDTSEFALSTQPPNSSIRRSTISVAKNHPAAAARQSKKPPRPQRESSWGAPRRQMLLKTLHCFLATNKTRRGLVYRLVPHLSGILHRLLSPPPVSDELGNSFAAVATYNDSGNTGGEGGLVDLSAVETVAATVRGGEVLSINSASDDSRFKRCRRI